MPDRFEITRRVAFSETDAAGIAHFANFFRWMEDVEHAFLRSLGSSVHTLDDAGLRGFPRVSASCDYLKPLRFEDEFTVALHVLEKQDKSLAFGFTFRKIGDDAVVAEGRITVVHVERPTSRDAMRAASIPKQLADQIEVYST